ncbi:MAG: GNAT family N-acetyltransferase [Bacteroidia bacterium]|nr:GNAT family N-acetyltransferase [Bacteroidia bacterium]
MIKGGNIFLRALEPSDVDALYQWENDPEVWRVSNTLTPWSRHVLEQYILSSHQDIYSTRQLRLVICSINDQSRLGCIDLFDFEPAHLRAGVGVLISREARGRGIGAESLDLLVEYAFKVLGLRQLYAGVTADNIPSQKLFESGGFVQTGLKKQWIRTAEGYVNEIFYQRLRNE